MDRQERVRLNNRGQFSIIAAMFVAVILVGTLMAVYSTIRYDSSQNQSPQVLTATDETDSAILKALGFTVGYYGSILQVTGNSTYAKANATAYMNSALQYISTMNPSWGTVLNMTSLNLSTNWFTNSSISTGQVSVIYNLAGLGLYGINYASSCSLRVQIFNSPSPNQICLNVTQDDTQPQMSLGQQNFNFYSYRYSDMAWQLIPPNVTPLVFTNGTYIINSPTGMNSSAYVIQVTDPRGIMVIASSFNSYNISFATSSPPQISPLTVELLQNGTVRWLGQNLQNSTMTQPIPPIPVKAFHISPYGTHLDLPYQIEDWASQYQIPLGLTNNYTLFGNNQMIVFQVSAAVPQVTLWWNGSDTATQPPSGFTDTCFVSDNPGGGTLTNGNTTIQISYPNGQFQINSTTGGVTSLTTFMRVNVNNSTYGSGSPAYVIHHGVVRDIVQEEAEWSNGITNCPNVYSQIVLTLPANSTYFTYQGRIMFINSAVSRSINDLSPIQLTTTIAHPQVMTENGTSGGLPLVSNSSGVFYNYGSNGTWTAHHWSQLINNSTGQGTGIMFTDAANQQLFAFDSMAGKATGGLYANASSSLIEIDPVTSRGPVSFTSALDLSWFGAVATFTNQLPIYTNSSGTPTGLWLLVEQPPAITVTPVNTNPSVILSPNTGVVGTSVTVSGSGFYPNSTITITYDGTTVATTVANASGFITSGVMFNVPASVAGSSHAVTATDTFNDSASASFTLTPFISLSPVAGNVGSTITVTGSGFNASSTIALNFSGLNLITSPPLIVSTSTGGFSATFSVPAFAAGVNVVQATDGANSYAAIFNVTSSISLNPQAGLVGSAVSVSGSGFASNSSITIKFDGANQNTTPAIVKTGSNGSFSATFVVPASAVGSHIVSSVDASSDTASANFTVTVPTVSLNPSSGSVGTMVTVSGSSFWPNSVLTVTYDGTTVATTNSTGSGAVPYGVTFTVPASVCGGHTVRVVDANGNAATATFTVAASINFTPVTGAVGTTITISGQGFAASSTITVKFNGATVATSPATVATDGTGSFSNVTFTVPSSSSGGKPAQAIDSVSNAASGTFTVTPSITLNPTSGDIGTTATITGRGFAASSTITVKYDGNMQSTSPSTVTSDANGSFSCSFTVPMSTAGTHTVLATDGTNSATATFGVGTVLQPITVTMSNSAPSSTVTVNGGNPSPSTFAADGNLHNINMTAGASFNLSFANAGNTRYGFAVSGSFSNTSNSYVASATQVSVTAYEQVQNTFSVTLSGGNPPSGDTLNLTGTFLGSAANVLSLNVGGQSSASNPAWTDYNTTVTFPSATTMSNSTQRWAINGPYSTPALTTGGNTYSQTYFDQYQMTLSDSVSGGGSGYSAPSFSANAFGASSPQTLTNNATVWWFDAGSSWNVTNPLSGSSGSERWQTNQTVSGSISSAATTVYLYYHQYQVTMAVNPSGSGTTTPAIGANWQNAGSLSIAATPNSGYGFDHWSSSTGSITFTSSTSSSTTATIGGPGTITSNFNVIVTEIVTITPANGYSSSDSVTVSGAGASVSSIPMDGQPHTFTANPSSTITFTVPTDGSSTRYRFNNAGSSSTTWSYTTASSGTDTKANTVYYQISVSFAYSTNDGTTINSQSNLVAYTQLGGTLHLSTSGSGTLSLSSDWADYRSSVTYVSPVTISSSERYMIASGDGGANTVISSVSTYNKAANPSYNHQYTITFGYGDQDSSAVTSGSQLGSYYQFGSSVAINSGSSYGATSPASAWVDAGSAKVSYQTFASSGQRWALSSSPATFTVSSSTTISDTNFFHQYTITFGYGDQDSSAVTTGSKIGSYYQFGSASAGTINSGSTYGGTSPASDWVDAGSAKVSYQTFTSGSQQWALQTSPATFNVASSTTISDSNFYHQYSLTVTATPSGAVGGTFQITYRQFGTTYTNQQQATTWNSWANAATTATVSSPQSPYNGYTFNSYTNNGATMNSAQTITLNYQSLDLFTFNTISSPQTAGTPFSITITAKDSSGNTVTGYTGTNTLSVSSGTISPTSTTAFVNGVWTGQVTLITTGSGITIGTTGGSPVKSGTSNAITVNSGSGTLGNTNTGTSTRSLSNYLRGIPVTATVTGTIQSISAYLNVGSTSRHVKAALYSTSGTLIGTTNEVTGLSSGARWVTMTFSGTKPTLTAGTTYILVVWADSGSGSVSIYYSSTSSNAGRYQSNSYGSWPNPASFTNENYLYCIYCNYSIP